MQANKGIDLQIAEGEFVGPSGCGTSALLRMIGGPEDISRGSLLINGNDVTDLPPLRRGLTMVFQSYVLCPRLTVAMNMGFSLKVAGVSKAEIAERAGIGRSIGRDPTAFLFDEPLSNLGAALRVEIRYEIAKLHQSLNRTMIYVIHDQVEAMTLADRIVVLESAKPRRSVRLVSYTSAPPTCSWRSSSAARR